MLIIQAVTSTAKGNEKETQGDRAVSSVDEMLMMERELRARFGHIFLYRNIPLHLKPIPVTYVDLPLWQLTSLPRRCRRVKLATARTAAEGDQQRTLHEI